jgi:Ca2+-binding EF-hand superfamily protein
MVEKAF